MRLKAYTHTYDLELLIQENAWVVIDLDFKQLTHKLNIIWMQGRCDET